MLRDIVRRYVIASLADGGVGAGPDGCGVLVVDETGFAKKGRSSAEVARQFTGTLGGVSPCQVGVMAAWATGAGQAPVDRELYLPKVWTGDRARCRVAHIPDELGFATKPRPAEKMIERILPDLPSGRVWVAADEVYGRDGAGCPVDRLRRLATTRAIGTLRPSQATRTSGSSPYDLDQ